MRKLINTSLDLLAYAVFCGLCILIILYVTPEKARAHQSYSMWTVIGSQTSCSPSYDRGLCNDGRVLCFMPPEAVS